MLSGTGNAIVNANYNNGGLGTDLGNDGVTANDPSDADSGPNKLQNFPDISYARKSSGMLKVTYTVGSDRAPGYAKYPIRVEFFKADLDGQEGRTFLGFDTFIDVDSAQSAKTVTFATASPVKVFDKIVVTATDSLAAAAGGGPANTSEFSPSVTIVSPWQNPGRLRWDVTDDTFVAAPWGVRPKRRRRHRPVTNRMRPPM